MKMRSVQSSGRATFTQTWLDQEAQGRGKMAGVVVTLCVRKMIEPKKPPLDNIGFYMFLSCICRPLLKRHQVDRSIRPVFVMFDRQDPSICHAANL